ncbi:hypothetical protein F4803DRAFT_207154 [Xylaria telfairii]|nr:hypothetical protein F4803DRAFT_207154 [Xylaria telfairii]
MDHSVSNSWLVSFPKFMSDVFESIQHVGFVHILWSPMSYLILGLVQTCSIIIWVFGLGLSVPCLILNNIIAFVAQPHIIYRMHQMVTTVAAMWFIIKHITEFLHSGSAQPTSDDQRSTRELYVDGSNEQQHIYWATREIVTNCDTHWRKFFTWGCHLEEGAQPEWIRKIDLLLGVKLPNDYKTFLQLTNGLNNVLDGGKPHLTFLSADNAEFAHFAKPDMYQEPSNQMRELYLTWVIEAMFGPNTHAKLTAVGNRGYRTERGVNLIKIAARGREQGGVFLICPSDVCNIAWDWGDVALNNERLCGRVIGEILHHTSTYFGLGHRLKMLRDWEDWLVLQVYYDPEKPRYRLYPSFTAFLQTLAEITRLPTDDLMTRGISERNYAHLCRRQWEWEWAKT